MKKLANIFIITLAVFISTNFLSVDAATKKNSDKNIKTEQSTINTFKDIDLSSIGFHKQSYLSPDIEIRKIFQDYEKYTNSKDLNGFLKLHDTSYRSADGYDIKRLEQLAIESWRDYPDLKYSINVLSLSVDIDNATVITNEKLLGTTDAKIDYVKGNGNIYSESTAIYYLQRFSNEWRIVSDFILNEKTYMRFGIAKYIPMRLDAPAMAGPEENYTAIIKMNMPSDYIALVSLTNEPITFPMEKSTEVFRGLKSDGIRERILKTNDGSKNENAVASIAIAQPDISNDMINISIAGVAFLSSRVNVIKHKFNSPDFTNIPELNTKTKIETEAESSEN